MEKTISHGIHRRDFQKANDGRARRGLAHSIGDIRASQRRIEPRFPAKRMPVVYWTRSNGLERAFCTILDVSQYGMRIRTARPLTTGTQVRVALREMSAIARLCYCNPVGNAFDQGLQVEELRQT